MSTISPKTLMCTGSHGARSSCRKNNTQGTESDLYLFLHLQCTVYEFREGVDISRDFRDGFLVALF